MNRQWGVWAVFGICLTVVLIAVGMISRAALILERAEAEARYKALVEENVQLALWRMDSAVAPLIAAENAHPSFFYRRTIWAGLNGASTSTQSQQSNTSIPSPLQQIDSPYVLLHFQFDPAGQISSPQVESPPSRQAAQPADHADPMILRLEELRRRVSPAEIRTAMDKRLVPRLPHVPTPLPPLVVGNVQIERQQTFDYASKGQKGAQSRSQLIENVQRQAVQQRQYNERPAQQQMPPRTGSAQQVRASLSQTGEWPQNEGLFVPLWVNDLLLLIRRVELGGEWVLQGCWLDWMALRDWLLSEVVDLLPHATLRPLLPGQHEAETRKLASLPVALIPGPLPGGERTGFTATGILLVAAWSAVLLAVLAVAALLFGAISLSERRGAFVSAVTHELRTPLTTFRMYTEMLTEGMIDKREEQLAYLTTLRIEADRLSHLVENVLAYARLERGRGQPRPETVRLGALLDPLVRRLADRATQANMRLTLRVGEAEAAAEVRADPGAVEQVLFNLVDNACKYANGQATPQIDIEAGLNRRSVEIIVQDHGPGVLPRERRRLFQPFRKSAHDAARSAPGVGLGLALSRRLARRMGGDLRLDPKSIHGARFVLTLPLAAKKRGNSRSQLGRSHTISTTSNVRSSAGTAPSM